MENFTRKYIAKTAQIGGLVALVNCASTPLKRADSLGHVRVQAGEANTRSVNGGLSTETVEAYVLKELRRMLKCHPKPQKAKGVHRGTVDLRFFVEAAGGVSEVKASGLGNSDIEDCVAEVISSIDFPKSDNGEPVSVYYPMTFSRASK